MENNIKSKKLTIIFSVWLIIAAVVLTAGVSVNISQKDKSPEEGNATAPSCADSHTTPRTFAKDSFVTISCGGTANALYDDSDKTIGTLVQGEVVKIIDSTTQCKIIGTKDYRYWNVETSSGEKGWTEESGKNKDTDAMEYWLQDAGSLKFWNYDKNCSDSKCGTATLTLADGDFVTISCGLPNTLRSAPTKSAKSLGEVDQGTALKIVDANPICNGGLSFWHVKYMDSGTEKDAWTAGIEGAEAYFVKSSETDYVNVTDCPATSDPGTPGTPGTPSDPSCTTPAKNCEATCGDGTMPKDACPNTFTSCEAWAQEACKGDVKKMGSSESGTGTGTCSSTCTGDGDCQSPLKCMDMAAAGGSGKFCRNPSCATDSSCPATCGTTATGTGTGACSSTCTQDSDCTSGLKCMDMAAAGGSGKFCRKESCGTETTCVCGAAANAGKCKSTCSGDGDCKKNQAGIQMKCIDKKCINPSCTLSENDSACYCRTSKCGDLCGPSAIGKLCTGTTTGGEKVGCYLINDPTKDACEFRCAPNEGMTQAPDGKCGNTCTNSGCLYQQAAAKSLTALQISCGTTTTIQCPMIDSTNGNGVTPDGKLTLSDFSAFSSIYNKSCTTSTESGCGSVDVNKDGTVQLNDFSYFVKYYNEASCTALIQI